MGAGRLILSLDFELHWGIRDHTPVERCAGALRGVWTAVPAILDVFRDYDVHATWAAVGMLFAADRDELESFLPALRPSYVDDRLSPYPALAQIGRDENDDPFHFAPSLLRQISEAPGQEIGTHTFSHYYALERGQTLEQYVADLKAALAIARHHGYHPSSIVFPRNQYQRPHLEPLPSLGIIAYRGATPGWLNRPGRLEDERAVRRGLRLVDAYVPISGPNGGASRMAAGVPGLVNVPKSRFLRPYVPKLRHLDRLRMRRICQDMDRAAVAGLDYHLWWHPHNFGTHLEPNLGFLRAVLDRFALLRESHGMRSVGIAERAEELAPELSARGA